MEGTDVAKRRAYRRKKARKKHLIAGFIIFVIVGLTVLTALSLTVLFPIKNVSFSGNKVYTVKQLEDNIGLKGKNIFTVSEKNTVNNAKKKLPYLESIKLRKKFPDSVSVEITEAKDYAAYKIGNKYYTVSKDGYVLAEKKTKPDGAIEIKTKSAKAVIGEKIVYSDPSAKDIIDQIIEKLENKKIKTDYIDVTSKTDITVGIRDGRFKVVLGTKQDIDKKVDHLCVMLGKVGDDEKGTINLSSWTESDPTGILVKE